MRKLFFIVKAATYDNNKWLIRSIGTKVHYRDTFCTIAGCVPFAMAKGIKLLLKRNLS